MLIFFVFVDFVLLQRGKNWAFQLVAVACLSMAAKIEEVNVPTTLDLQVKIYILLMCCYDV